MGAKHLTFLTCALVLAGCHDGPSTSEAKAAVMDMLGGGCSRLQIEDFQKVNGVAQGDGEYDVAVKYTLVVTPPQGNDITETAYDSRLAELETSLEQARQAQASAHDRYMSPNPSPADYTDYEAKTKVFESLDSELKELKAQPTADISRDCPGISSDVVQVISGGLDDFLRKNPDKKNAYLSGFSVAVTDTVHLMKTDNGWKTNL